MNLYKKNYAKKCLYKYICMHKQNCINIRIYLKICHTLYQTCKLKKCSPLQSVFISGPSFSFASIGKLETVPK